MMTLNTSDMNDWEAIKIKNKHSTNASWIGLVLKNKRLSWSYDLHYNECY